MKKKVLFIDRDGTIVIEPKADGQLDSFEKLEFYPEVFKNLERISRLDYELVMVTNQDGLGTESFPEETFWPVHNFICSTLENENIKFENVYIDKSLPEDNAPTRKPKTGMLEHYIKNPKYDLKESYVIGDRLTDIELAKNLKTKAILINDTLDIPSPLKASLVLQTSNWNDIYNHLSLKNRFVKINRKTNETDISIELNLDGTGVSDISTGLHFFDHMLEQIARHGQLDLKINAKGDLHIDEHHTIEDTAIALGEAFLKAMNNKYGMERYGFCLPMDDALAQVVIDFGGRSWLIWDVKFKREHIGDTPTEMFEHFFKSFSDSARANINIKAVGRNEHHKAESIFKAFAKAVKMAIKRDSNKMILPSTKGMI